jgi:hypothetical protein
MASAAALRGASLVQLVPQSDAIVVGTQSAVARSGDAVTFNLAVERVFKGNLGVGSVVGVTWSSTRSAAAHWAGSPSYRGIWFLQQAPGGGWACIPAASIGNRTTVADLPFPVSTGPLPAALAYDPSNTALTDQLALEIAATQPANPAVVLYALAGGSSASALQALRYVAANRSGDLGLIGLAGLIEQNDVPTMLQVEQMAGALDMTSYGARALAASISIVFRNPDPSGVASLGRIATSPTAPAKLQEAATEALRAIHSPAALPYLGLLVTSNSASLQLPAAQGISYFVNGVGVVTPQSAASMSYLGSGQPSVYYTADTKSHLGYRTGQEASFIAYWQGWWQQHPELHTVN